MSTLAKKHADGEAVSSVPIERKDWADFLRSFSERHHHWLVSVQTFDRVTDENVVSSYMSLEAMEYVLEDERNPQVTLTVKMDNKLIKHILVQPSRLTLVVTPRGTSEALTIESANTQTTVRFRVAVEPELVDHLV